jgi:hypothetical protein
LPSLPIPKGNIGPIRAALLIAILQTPHRFRTKRQLWAYGGLAIETHSSADHRYVEGQLRPSKKQVSLRGLNRNHNHELKNIFKGAAIIAATKAGPFQEFYAALVAKGMNAIASVFSDLKTHVACVQERRKDRTQVRSLLHCLDPRRINRDREP